MEASAKNRKSRPGFFHPSACACFFLLLSLTAKAQCFTSLQYYDQLAAFEKSGAPNPVKLEQVLTLSQKFRKCGLPEDSVYARMMHRIGVLESLENNLSEAVRYTREAIRINGNGHLSSAHKMILSSTYNLGFFYMEQHFYAEALEAFDKCFAEGKDGQDSAIISKLTYARHKRGFIFHQLGDDQRSLSETTLGLRSALPYRNNKILLDLYIAQAEAHASLQNIQAAITDLDQALRYLSPDDHKAYADNLKLRARTLSGNNDKQALDYYNKAIEARKQADVPRELAKDYLDAGNFILDHLSGTVPARPYYEKAYTLAKDNGDQEVSAKALNNLGIISLRTKRYEDAREQFDRSLSELLSYPCKKGAYENPSYRRTNAANKVFLYQLLSNKTESLLSLYKTTNSDAYLKAALTTALLTDSVITGMRHEQTEELSKLHWLKDARDFFANALEACFLSRNTSLAFYFMEKSRSVLLNDKLNELGANALLPARESAREREFLFAMLSEEQQWSKWKAEDPLYREHEARYLEAKERFEVFTRSLQARYPVYYQYKYADDVPPYDSFKKTMRVAGESFVHYFVSDTCVFVLATTPDSGQLIRQCVQSNSLLAGFLKLCSDKQALNRNYAQFTGLSHQLYQIFFQPLKLSTRHVIICNDNFLLPFEALSPDAAGKEFLLSRYVFSYAYSARSLLRKFDNPSGAGDCLLVSPGSYAAALNVSNLDEAQNFVKESQMHYRQTRLLLGMEASKKNFLDLFSRYRIVNIYSHATADSNGTEPFLYMRDSVVRLSELEFLSRPSTKLVVLTACETSAGRNAAGEGIFSLARGFAAAGIPSIASTLWKADSKAMSVITNLFHQNISRGMRKDEALQQAKLTFIKQSGSDGLLPYYWANIILAGNSDPIRLEESSGNRIWWVMAVLVVLLGGGLAGYRLYRKQTWRI